MRSAPTARAQRAAHRYRRARVRDVEADIDATQARLKPLDQKEQEFRRRSTNGER
jgi:hypothetical protein